MEIQYLYDDEGYLTGTYQGTSQKENSTTLQPPEYLGKRPRFLNGKWVDYSKENQVGPVEFKLLFTSPERLTLKELRNTDAALADFFEIIEDPRLQYVDLSLGSTAAGVDHCLSLLTNAEVISESEAATRREEILSGTLL